MTQKLRFATCVFMFIFLLVASLPCAGQTKTITQLQSSNNPSSYGQSVTFTSIVSGANPSGTVDFWDGTTDLGTGTWSNANATNLLLRSSGFVSATTPWPWDIWTSAGSNLYTVVRTNATAPDGSSTATEFSVNGDAGSLTLQQFVAITPLLNKTVTASVFLRSASMCGVTLGTEKANTTTYPYWDGGYSFLVLTSDWQRYTVTHTYLQEGDSVSLYVEANQGCTIDVWGAQLELAGSAGPYVATTTAAASGSGGVVTFVPGTPLAPGSHNMTAVYSGDTSNQSSTSVAVTQLVTNGTATELRSSSNPSVAKHTVTLTALVHTSGGAVPTGTVSFSDVTTAPPVSLGTPVTITEATATNLLPHSRVFDEINWSMWFESGGGGSLFVYRNQLAPDGTNSATELGVSAPGTNLYVGQSISAGSSVYGRTFTGSVFLRSAGACSATLGTETPVTWDGDSINFSVSSTWQRYTVTHAYANDLDGSSVSLYLLVAPGCDIYVWGPQLEEASTAGPYVATDAAAATGSGGIATLDKSFDPDGTYFLSATYNPEASSNFATSNTLTRLTQTVTAPPVPTVTVESTPNPSAYDETVTFTGTAAAPIDVSTVPTGTMIFYDGATSLGSGTLSDGWASLNCGPGLACGALSVGSHSITAVYGGDSLFATKTSAALTQTVNQDSTITVVESSSNPSGYGAGVTFTATVAGSAGGIPTGTIIFKIDGSTVGAPVGLSAGWASVSISSLTVGSHAITAIYSGDANFTGSTGALTQSITGNVSTATALTGTPNPSSYGEVVTFEATVTASGGGTPTGTVAFKDGTTTVGTAALASGGNWATLNCGPGQPCATLAAGPHSITALYSGNSNFAASTSPALTQIVTEAAAQDFTLPATNPPQTVTAGQPATWTITITPGAGGFTGTVQFSCSSRLPPGAACSFAPASVTPGSSPVTTNLSITTTPRGIALSRPASPWRGLPFYAVLFPLAGVIMIGGVRRQSRGLMLLLVVALLALLASCGGGGSSTPSPTPTPTQTGTPAGSYTVVVSAQSGATTHTTSVTLNVQ